MNQSVNLFEYVYHDCTSKEQRWMTSRIFVKGFGSVAPFVAFSENKHTNFYAVMGMVKKQNEQDRIIRYCLNWFHIYSISLCF